MRYQAQNLRAPAEVLLGQVPLQAGHQAIDLGCGPGGVIDLLSERVGPNGHVVGLDASAQYVALARAFIGEHRLGKASVIQGDARHTGLPAASFDLVHARLLLVNIPGPAEVLAEMVRLAKPGGWVASQEIDGVTICQPRHPAWDQLTGVLRDVYGHDGADIHIGRRVPGLVPCRRARRRRSPGPSRSLPGRPPSANPPA